MYKWQLPSHWSTSSEALNGPAHRSQVSLSPPFLVAGVFADFSAENSKSRFHTHFNCEVRSYLLPWHNLWSMMYDVLHFLFQRWRPSGSGRTRVINYFSVHNAWEGLESATENQVQEASLAKYAVSEELCAAACSVYHSCTRISSVLCSTPPKKAQLRAPLSPLQTARTGFDPH